MNGYYVMDNGKVLADVDGSSAEDVLRYWLTKPEHLGGHGFTRSQANEAIANYMRPRRGLAADAVTIRVGFPVHRIRVERHP